MSSKFGMYLIGFIGIMATIALSWMAYDLFRLHYIFAGIVEVFAAFMCGLATFQVCKVLRRVKC